jgi:hypothetical protein
MLLILGTLLPLSADAQDAPDISAGPLTTPVPIVRSTPQPAEDARPTAPPPPMLPTPPPFDPTIFLKPIPADQLTFLKSFAGGSAGDAMRDRQFRHVLKEFVPDCMFHYGRDMPLSEALDTVFANSRYPVQLRDDRYLLLAGNSGPYLRGRAFLWIDLKLGFGLGGFFFAPTNGEPSPTLAVFSRQVKEQAIGLSELPPEFSADLASWSASAGLPPITVRYFLNGSNRRILLEHDEDFCSPTDGTVTSSDDCEQQNADAADIDITTAYYLEQVHYATNATAWMIRNPDMLDWIVIRDRTCRSGPNPLACRVRLTHERVRVVTGRPPIRR